MFWIFLNNVSGGGVYFGFGQKDNQSWNTLSANNKIQQWKNAKYFLIFSLIIAIVVFIVLLIMDKKKKHQRRKLKKIYNN
jgi:hypothetical protein